MTLTIQHLYDRNSVHQENTLNELCLEILISLHVYDSLHTIKLSAFCHNEYV